MIVEPHSEGLDAPKGRTAPGHDHLVSWQNVESVYMESFGVKLASGNHLAITCSGSQRSKCQDIAGGENGDMSPLHREG